MLAVKIRFLRNKDFISKTNEKRKEADWKSFNDYQKGQAWTWEHMALTRGRVISGPDTLRIKIETIIHNILSHPGRAHDNLLHEVAKMRVKLAENFGTDNIWSMKNIRGGIIDIEFICQYTLLANGDKYPSILKRNTLRQLKEIKKAKILSADLNIFDTKFLQKLNTLE